MLKCSYLFEAQQTRLNLGQNYQDSRVGDIPTTFKIL